MSCKIEKDVYMTATDELRSILDKRGIEWSNVRHDGSESDYFTEWCPDGTKDYASACEWSVGGGLSVKIIRDHCTPEQAIAATLGRGTCHITPKFTCSECGYQYPTRNFEYYKTCDGRTAYASLGYDVLDCEKPSYCLNCGARVVDEW